MNKQAAVFFFFAFLFSFNHTNLLHCQTTQWAIQPQFNDVQSYDAYYLARKEKTWTAVLPDGSEILPLKYDSLAFLSMEHIGIREKGQWGVWSIKEKKQIIPFAYESITPFIEGLACVKSGGKWGIINTKGTLLLPCAYGPLSYSPREGVYRTISEIKGEQGEIVFAVELSPTKQQAIGMAAETSLCGEPPMKAFNFKALGAKQAWPTDLKTPTWVAFQTEGGLYQLKDQDQQLLDKRYFKRIQPFGESLLLLEGVDGIHVVDVNTKQVINAAPFAAIQVQGFQLLYPFADADFQWGIMDATGKILVKPIYNDLFYLSGGIMVAQNYQWGVLDCLGKVQIPIEYDQCMMVPEKKLAWLRKGNQWGLAKW